MIIKKHVNFTNQQKERAASVDLEEFLRRRGEKLIPSGQDKRLDRDHSVTIQGNRWFDHAAERGGGPISFVEWFYELDYQDAVTMLLGGETGEVYPPAKERQEREPKPFALPPANRDMRRVYAYLVKHRHIAWAIVDHFARAKTLYEDEKYHNCVFVGTDEDGVPRHAHKRSTNSYGEVFRINVEGGDPQYSFHHIGTDGSLYVFEAPIDLLSYITLHPRNWKSHSYVACCGVSFIPVQKMVERMPQVDTVYLCMDNDKAGHRASARMAQSLSEMGISSERIISENKDWNEDLVAKYEKKEEIGLCQVCGY